MRFELAMFDFSWSELLLIGIVALVAIGPKELPGALRTLGQWVAKVRRMATEFQNQFHEAMREAELADLKKEVDEMTVKAQSYANFDPISDIRQDLEKAASPPPELSEPLSVSNSGTGSAVAAAGDEATSAGADSGGPAETEPAPAVIAQNEPTASISGAAGESTPEAAKPNPVTPDPGRAA
jgi:sec-independent protein translocase protein TatB